MKYILFLVFAMSVDTYTPEGLWQSLINAVPPQPYTVCQVKYHTAHY
jgi:hypothetical protein